VHITTGKEMHAYRVLLYIFISLWQLNAHGDETLLSSEDQASIIFFIERQQDIVQNNEKILSRLVRRMSKNQIKGLELIVAASGKTRMESRFGHTLLRFVDDNGNASDDIVLSFVADLDGPELSSRRGIFGGYPIYPLLKTFRMFNKDYVKNDERSLERHIIPSTREMRKELVEKLIEQWNELQTVQLKLDKEQVEKARKEAFKASERLLGPDQGQLIPIFSADRRMIYAWNIVQEINGEKIIKKVIPVDLKLASTKAFGRYKFFSNNCSGALVKLIQNSNFPNRGSLLFAGRIPVKMPVYFEKSLLNPLPSISIPSLRGLKEKLRSLLSLDKIEGADPLLNLELWPKNADELILKGLSLLEKMQVLDAISPLPKEVISTLANSLPEYRERPSYDEIYQIRTLPLSLYKTCVTSECIEELKTSAFDTWNTQKIRSKRKKLKRLLKKIEKGSLKKSLKLRPQIVLHHKLLFL
jgi:hypothetical protein